jgi:hypothetical protein
MNVSYKVNGQQWNEGNDLLQKVTEQLEDIVGKSAEQVTAEWKRGQDKRGRTLYTLNISDSTEQVAADFAPQELRSPSQMRLRLLELWGDFLQVRSHKQLQKLTEDAGQVGE